MSVATLATATSSENRKAVIAGTIGNVLEWYDFGVYGYLATTMSQLFFPGEDKTISLLKAASTARTHLPRCRTSVSAQM
jgi:MFS transporter, MHS family, proline/betaine transporter